MRWFALLIVSAVCLVPLSASAADKFVPLFDGKTLEGWEGDPALWRVEGGNVVGTTADKQITANSFLATKKSYKNFILKLKFKLVNHNSGVQFRSQLHKDYRVTGYQADIADNEYMGILYEEGGRGILANVKAEEVAKHNHKGDWNEYVITADHAHITQQLNGYTTVDYTEKDSEKGATEGIIGLQLHVGPPMRVEFKDIEIAELP
jgi:Domain of Unknown Function (DUF1080)